MKALEMIKLRTDNNLLKYKTILGDAVEVECSFNKPATEQDITIFEQKNCIILPEQYKAFLKYTNGAILFKGTSYDEGGFILQPLDKLIETTKKYVSYGYDIKEKWIVFAEIFGNSDFLLFDLEYFKAEPRKFIIDGDSGYQSNEWSYINGDFFSWLNRVIITNGDAYWRWY